MRDVALSLSINKYLKEKNKSLCAAKYKERQKKPLTTHYHSKITLILFFDSLLFMCLFPMDKIVLVTVNSIGKSVMSFF